MGLYTGIEESKLLGFTDTYNAALADFQTKTADYNNFLTFLAQNPGAASSPQAANNKITKENAVNAAKAIAVQCKIDLEDYQSYLNDKYQQVLSLIHI